MKKFFYSILILIAGIAGCQKLDVEPTTGTPVFSVAAEVAGMQKTWQAGVDDYYLFSGFEKDSNDVYVFTGNLRQTNCPSGCGESFEVKIRDFQQVLQGTPAVMLALQPRDYFFKSPTADIPEWQFDTTVFYRTIFDASASVTTTGAANFNWNFGGLGTASGPSPVFDFDQLDQSIPVTLTLAGNSLACSSFQTRRVQKPTPNSLPCSVQIFAENDASGAGTILTAIVAGMTPFSYSWSSGAVAQSILLPPNQQPQATVTVTDGQGCTSVSHLSFLNNPGTTPQYCSASFAYEVEKIIEIDSTLQLVPGDSLHFSKISLEYTDAAGKHYRSDLQDQPVFSFFKILSAEDYDANENGEKTKKLSFLFACRLWSEQGDYLDFQNGTAVMAVAYP